MNMIRFQNDVEAIIKTFFYFFFSFKNKRSEARSAKLLGLRGRVAKREARSFWG